MDEKFDHDHYLVEPGAFLYPDHKKRCEKRHNADGRKIANDRDAENMRGAMHRRPGLLKSERKLFKLSRREASRFEAFAKPLHRGAEIHQRASGRRYPEALRNPVKYPDQLMETAMLPRYIQASGPSR